jgi:hypothetical protein
VLGAEEAVGCKQAATEANEKGLLQMRLPRRTASVDGRLHALPVMLQRRHQESSGSETAL